MQIIRHCPDCGRDRPFDQHHPASGSCPDVRDGQCPEWLCTGCGAAVMTAAPPSVRAQADPAELHDRVA